MCVPHECPLTVCQWLSADRKSQGLASLLQIELCPVLLALYTSCMSQHTEFLSV